jgi:hypothetical protein
VSDCRECQGENERLERENERLQKLGKEFIWGEENPHEYESEMTKLRAENERLERENERLRSWKAAFVDDLAEVVETLGAAPEEGKPLLMLGQIEQQHDRLKAESDQLRECLRVCEEQNVLMNNAHVEEHERLHACFGDVDPCEFAERQQAEGIRERKLAEDWKAAALAWEVAYNGALQASTGQGDSRGLARLANAAARAKQKAHAAEPATELGRLHTCPTCGKPSGTGTEVYCSVGCLLNENNSEPANLVNRFESLSMEVPYSDEEVEEIINEAGIDSDVVLAQLMSEAEKNSEPATIKESLTVQAHEFATKLERLPAEIRAMSGVPNDVKKGGEDE